MDSSVEYDLTLDQSGLIILDDPLLHKILGSSANGATFADVSTFHTYVYKLLCGPFKIRGDVACSFFSIRSTFH